jgi:ATP-dependent protease ClpP protease subunit
MFIYINIFFLIGLLIFSNYKNLKILFIKKYKNLSYRKVYLFSDLDLYIKGKITKTSINKVIDKIGNNKNINLIIDSNGGDFMAGYKLISKMIKLQKKTLTSFDCYAINAKSTAFDIFQFCDKRYVSPISILFQHNASIEFIGSFEELKYFYSKFIIYKKILDNININISKRIKLNHDEYLKKINNNWLIKGGEEIINYNLADEIVIIIDKDFIKNM